MEKPDQFHSSVELHKYILSVKNAPLVLMRSEEEYSKTISEGLFDEALTNEEFIDKLELKQISPALYLQTLIDLIDSYAKMIKEILSFIEGNHGAKDSLNIVLEQKESISELLEKFMKFISVYEEKYRNVIQIRSFQDANRVLQTITSDDDNLLEKFKQYNFISKHFQDYKRESLSPYYSINLREVSHDADIHFQNLINFLISKLEDLKINDEGIIQYQSNTSQEARLGSSLNDLDLGARISNYQKASSQVKDKFMDVLEEYLEQKKFIDTSLERILDFPFWKDRSKLYELWCIVKLLNSFKGEGFYIENLQDGWDEGMDKRATSGPLNPICKIRVYKDGQYKFLFIYYEPEILDSVTPDIVIKDTNDNILYVIEVKDKKGFKARELEELREKYRSPSGEYSFVVLNHMSVNNSTLDSANDYLGDTTPDNTIAFKQIVHSFTSNGCYIGKILLLDVSSSMEGFYSDTLLTKIKEEQPIKIFLFSDQGIDLFDIDKEKLSSKIGGGDILFEDLKKHCASLNNYHIEIISDSDVFQKLSTT